MRYALSLLVLMCVACQGGEIAPTYERDDFGSSLAFGDYTCDGLTDLAVGARGADRIDVFVANQTGFATNPISLYASSRGNNFGADIVAVGDVNGDSCDDLLVLTNRAELYAGSASGLQPSALWINDDHPWASGAGGDVDGDGFADVLLGGLTQARLYAGSSAGVASAPVWQGEQDPDGGDRYGENVAIFDFDDDGTLDVIVADPRFDDDNQNGANHGRLYGYVNDAAPDPPAADPTVIVTGDQDMQAGSIFLFAYFDNDTQADLILGFPQERQNDREGEVWVYFGPELGNNEDVVYGEQNDQNFGTRVAVGEVDGERYLAVAAPGFDSGRGEVRFFHEQEVSDTSIPQEDYLLTGNNNSQLGTNLVQAPSDQQATQWLLGTTLNAIDIEGAAAVYAIGTDVPQTPVWTGTGR